MFPHQSWAECHAEQSQAADADPAGDPASPAQQGPAAT